MAWPATPIFRSFRSTKPDKNKNRKLGKLFFVNYQSEL